MCGYSTKTALIGFSPKICTNRKTFYSLWNITKTHVIVRIAHIEIELIKDSCAVFYHISPGNKLQTTTGGLRMGRFKKCGFTIARLIIWSQDIQFYSEIDAIPHNSAIFSLNASIDSKSAVSNSTQNFWDNFPRYSRTLCISKKKE